MTEIHNFIAQHNFDLLTIDGVLDQSVFSINHTAMESYYERPVGCSNVNLITVDNKKIVIAELSSGHGLAIMEEDFLESYFVIRKPTKAEYRDLEPALQKALMGRYGVLATFDQPLSNRFKIREISKEYNGSCFKRVNVKGNVVTGAHHSLETDRVESIQVWLEETGNINIEIWTKIYKEAIKHKDN